jgi:hypothetical protein
MRLAEEKNEIYPGCFCFRGSKGKKEIYPGSKGAKMRVIQGSGDGKWDLSRFKNESYPGWRQRKMRFILVQESVGKMRVRIDVLIFVPHAQRHVATDPEAAGFATAISDCRLAA